MSKYSYIWMLCLSKCTRIIETCKNRASMNWLKSLILFILLLVQQVAYTQNEVKLRTLAIIDTSRTKFEQAGEIYNWITNNIKYDVNAFLKGDYSYKSTSAILHDRKGICKDYSELFNEMCHYAGIESYTVAGYAKGPDFFTKDGFFRANHGWNAFYIDSTWYLADLTWGSGYLKRVPTLFDKVKHSLFNEPVINKRWVYVKAPDNGYFNPSSTSFLLTHMPLDPKWQLKNYPYILSGFEKGMPIESSDYLNLKDALQSSRGSSFSHQLYVEGVNGKKFNPKNNFDIGFGLLQLAGEFDYQNAVIDTESVSLFTDNLDLYKKAQNYISKHQVVTDSVYKRRIAMLKKAGNDGRKVSANLIRINKNGDELYAKNQKVLQKRLDDLSKRIEKYEYRMNIENQKNNKSYIKENGRSNNSAMFVLNLSSLCKSVSLSSRLRTEIDSLAQISSTSIPADSLLSIECIDLKRYLISQTLDLGKPLSNEDNQLLFSSWDTVQFYFHNVMTTFRLKSRNLVIARACITKINTNLMLMAYELNKQLVLIDKMTVHPNDYTLTVGLADSLHALFKEACLKVVDILKCYQRMNEGLMDFNATDYKLNKELGGLPLLNISIFAKYADELFLEQKNFYLNEITLIKGIHHQCNIGKIRIEKRLSAYYTRINKSKWGK